MRRAIIALLLPLFTGGWGAASMGQHSNGSLVTGGGGCAAALFEDAFTREDSGTVGGNWDSETDTGTLLSISSNALLYTHTATTVAYVHEDLAGPYTTFWYQFDLTFHEVASLGSNTTTYVATILDEGGNVNHHLRILTNSSGDMTSAEVRYLNDSVAWANLTSAGLSWSVDTAYTFKVKLIKETGADASDGVIEVWRDGTSIISSTSVDNYTYGDLDRVRLGSASANSQTSITQTILWDNFEIREDDCF